MDKSVDKSRRAVLATVGTGVASAIATASLPRSIFAAGAQAPGFVGIDSWVNSPPLSMAGLRGRVVLVTFWTRQCINCLHAMPYMKALHGKYAARGFILVGVHTPEFEVERSLPALQTAVARYGIHYAVAQDNESATWNAWGNRYWPAEYIVDRSGRIVYSHAGEGGYAEMDGLVRNLLG